MTDVVLDGERLAFDVYPEDNPKHATADWHFELQGGAGGQIAGEIERRSTGSAGQGPSHHSLRLQRTPIAKLRAVPAFCRQLPPGRAHVPARAGDDADGDVFFVGYGSNPANRGNSNYVYITRGDRMQQIVPIAPATFLADDGASHRIRA